MGYNPHEFGLYSLRAGGAMAAANNGVPGRLLRDMVAGSLMVPKMVMLRVQQNIGWTVCVIFVIII